MAQLIFSGKVYTKKLLRRDLRNTRMLQNHIKRMRPRCVPLEIAIVNVANTLREVLKTRIDSQEMFNLMDLYVDAEVNYKRAADDRWPQRDWGKVFYKDLRCVTGRMATNQFKGIRPTEEPVNTQEGPCTVS